ncbi:MAG TPA: hypothetical protein VHO06_13155 [Polyangia bacterium]|nr:hypothetical protein [Polyangia bacterium]
MIIRRLLSAGGLAVSLLVLPSCTSPTPGPATRPPVVSTNSSATGALTQSGSVIPTGNVSYTTTWIGNTYGNSDGRHVQDFVNAIAVAPNGTIYTNTYWDESGYESVAYSTDGASMKPLGNTHGVGGIAIALNASYVYVGQSNAVSSTDYQYGLTRRTIGDPTQGAPFNTGATLGTLGQAFLVVNNNVTTAPSATSAAQIAGLAANGSYLYVSNPYASQILIYDASSMAQLATISVPNSQQIALDPNGGLWAVQRATGSLTGNVLHYSAYVPGQTPTLLGSLSVSAPAGIGFDASDRLFVTDDTVNQQVSVYNAAKSPPTLTSSIGVNGGVSANVTGAPPGVVASNKLVWPVAVGVDASDNVYVGSSASGTDLRKFTLSGTMDWMLKASLFLDVPVADPSTDGAVFYGHDSGYNFNYALGAGKEWSYRSFTIDKLHDPQDLRYVDGSTHRSTVGVQVLSNQKKYIMVSDQQSGTAGIYRFNGEVAVPSVIFGNFGQPVLPGMPTGASSYVWTDSNGDGVSEAGEFFDVSSSGSSSEWGRDFDANGGVWRTNVAGVAIDPSIVYYPLQGFDAHANPIYTQTAPVQWAAPAPFTEVDRIKYIPAKGTTKDTLYVTGCTTAAPCPSPPTFGLVGTTMARYDGWLGGNQTPTWQIALPYDPADSRAVKAVDVAGSRVFAGMLGSNAAEDVYVYDATDGNYLGQLTPGPQIGSQMGAIDMDFGLRAYQRQSTGEYVVTVEDVVYGKAIVYRGTMNPIAPPSALPDISSNGLVLSLDPALASQGTDPFYSGSSGSCTPAQLNWADVATLDLSSLPFDGVLTNFGACNSQLGWVGNGTSASPYSLAMNASSALVTTAQNLNITGDAAFTLSAWVVLNPAAGWNGPNPPYNSGILGFGSVPTGGEGVGLLYGYRAGAGILSVEYGNLEGYYSGSQAVPAGKWVNLVYTKSPGPIATTSALYLDGALIQGAAASPQTPAGAAPNLTTTPLYIGQWGAYWPLGNALLSVGDVQVYDRALAPSEVEANCAALASRYGG